MPSHASHTRRCLSLLAVVAAGSVSALAAANASATEPDVVAEVSPAPVEVSPAPEGEVLSSSVCSRSAQFGVHRARIRGGRLAIDGRLARGVTGQVRGIARYRGGELRFRTSVEGRGRIAVDRRMPGGKSADTARVTLFYPGAGCFQPKRVTLNAVRHAARTRVRAAGGPSV